MSHTYTYISQIVLHSIPLFMQCFHLILRSIFVFRPIICRHFSMRQSLLLNLLHRKKSRKFMTVDSYLWPLTDTAMLMCLGLFRLALLIFIFMWTPFRNVCIKFYISFVILTVYVCIKIYRICIFMGRFLWESGQFYV